MDRTREMVSSGLSNLKEAPFVSMAPERNSPASLTECGSSKLAQSRRPGLDGQESGEHVLDPIRFGASAAGAGEARHTARVDTACSCARNRHVVERQRMRISLRGDVGASAPAAPPALQRPGPVPTPRRVADRRDARCGNDIALHLLNDLMDVSIQYRDRTEMGKGFHELVCTPVPRPRVQDRPKRHMGKYDEGGAEEGLQSALTQASCSAPSVPGHPA